MLFVGHASSDPKNYLGAGDSDLVPTRMLDTVTMETASDDWFAAFGDDGLAQMQIGRLPARTLNEAALMVAKIIEHDAASKPAGVTLVADQTTSDFNFGAASTLLKPMVPASLTIDDIQQDQVDPATAKGQLIAALAAGRQIVNYAGHGSVDLWRNNVLTSSDALALTNWANMPLFVVMSCLNGYFEDPVVESLAESLLKAPNGGASAVWAPSGMTDAGRQAVMNQALFRSMFSDDSTRTLGDAVAKAKASAEDTDIRLTWVLFGDPLMKKRPEDKLYDTAGREIIFYHMVGCWANPPANYLQILDAQQQEINQLMQTNTVILIPCRISRDAV